MRQRAMIEQPHNLRPHHTERVITAGRLLLAVFLVLAVHLDPTDPAMYATLLQRLSLAYVLYAGLVALLIWTRRTTPGQVPLITHVVDLVLFSVFMHLTQGPASPFFVYFIFATVCGALRWHGRGALLTGAAALAASIAVTLISPMFLLAPAALEQNRFITRCTQLAVITLLLAYLGAYHRRLQTEIASLSAWPRRLPAEPDEAVRDALSHAAAILRVPRILLTWQEGEEPSLRIAVRDQEQFELSRERPDAFGSLVAEPLQRSSFICDDASASACDVVYRVPGGLASMRGRPLDKALCDRYQVRSVLALRIATAAIDGRLFALDRRFHSADDLLLGDIVARFIASALEQQALIMQLRESAAGEERLRLARELHDGVLQSLTAVGLQAGRLRELAGHDSAETAHRLALLEETIATEQRRLRLILEDLHPGRAVERTRMDPCARLREVATRVGRQWEVPVRCDLARDVPHLSGGLVHEICRMTEESVVNAIRHGGAKEVSVALEPVPDDALRLSVSYRGRGFATFKGRHDLASLIRMQAGPRTLKERVAELGGDLIIESDESGARVEVVVSAGSRS